MKKKYLIIILLMLLLQPFKVFASGGFSVSNSSISMYIGETKTVTITSKNAVGKLNISSTNSAVASISTGSIFIQMPGGSESITITAKSKGTSNISVVGTNQFATMEEEILEGVTKTITVNVKEKETLTPSNSEPPHTPQPTAPVNQNNNSNLSRNNNIKTITIEGYELEKIDNKNYSLVVPNDITKINLSAVAEDSKATITGIGSHELEVGENTIEVVVKSESGISNIINIKITRKDGFYLEDLDTILSKEDLKEAEIIIDKDSIIKKEEIKKIKDSKKTIKLNFYNEDKKILYVWTINGQTIKESKEFSTTISFTTKNLKEIYKISNYADGLYINFKHNGDLPKGTKVKLNVGNKFDEKSLVNLYHYNEVDKKLENVKSNLEVKKGYIEFDIEHCSDYFVTMSTINNMEEKESNSFTLLFIFNIIVILALIVVLIILLKMKKNQKKEENIDMPKRIENNNNFYNNISINEKDQNDKQNNC